MSNNKQSSVEQFAIALYENGFLQGNGDEINDLLEYHKAIHKEEIEDAIIDSQKEYISTSECYPPEFVLRKAEQYYEETFENNEQQ